MFKPRKKVVTKSSLPIEDRYQIWNGVWRVYELYSYSLRPGDTYQIYYTLSDLDDLLHERESKEAKDYFNEKWDEEEEELREALRLEVTTTKVKIRT